ncbi:MAG: hypothetical protein PHN64_09170 [Desulfovibrionaceae bacterium]|nr:hypothetical protein [Desulfovibrionaceae bacterium]
MINPRDLDEFHTYMTSGEMEKDFAEGCEHDRFYLLELLEKLMDVAETADATATKLIFKGQLAALAGVKTIESKPSTASPAAAPDKN